jgi:2-amino-4-hydroxy-6-hydroxymethyldihydropteridine diphosphokinase
MIVVGLGGNVGSDAEIVARFVRARELVHAVRSARLYRSAAIGPDQPAFLNTAVLVDELPPIFDIERQLGRERTVRWGPRTIDLDVLVGDVPRDSGLHVPHPRLAERRFALAPLVDLLGDDFMIPGIGRAGDALERVRDQDCEVMASAW